jgi:hypothetical protein
MKLSKPLFAPHTSLVERVWYFVLRGVAVLTLLYLILPVLAIVPLSFSSSTFLVYPIPGWSLRWYQNLIASTEWRMAAKNSFIVAPSATVVATVLGTLAAIGLTKANFRGKALLMAILISPMIVPVVVVGVGMYLFFAPLGLANTYIGLILAHASLGVPFVVTTVAATLQGFNYNLVRASLSLGANPHYVTGDRAGRDLGRAVRVRDVVRRSGRDAVPSRCGSDDAAASDVHRYPRKHQPDHRGTRDDLDYFLDGPAARARMVAWAQCGACGGSLTEVRWCAPASFLPPTMHSDRLW